MFENDRLDRLFETLRGTAPLPSKHLAQALGVSERTLRNDISKLNNKLATCGAQISTKWHEGYYLEVLDNSAFDAFLTSTQCASSGPVLDTTDDRIRLMLTTLLLARGSESVSELARTITVGAATIQSYLARVRAILSPYGLECIVRRNEGLQVYGSEQGRRDCLLNEVALGGEDVSSRLTTRDRQLVSPVDADKVLDIVRRGCARLGVGISDWGLKRSTMALCIATARIKSGHLVEQGPYQSLTPMLMHLIQVICQELEGSEQILMPECERTRAALILTRESDADIEPINEEALGRNIDRILEAIMQDYGIDLRADDLLRMNLTSHLAIIIKNHRLDVSRRNPILNTIKSSFPLAFEATTASVNEAIDNGSIPLNEDEMGYIALHVGAAMERSKPSQRTPSQLALICDARPSATEMLAARVSTLFGSAVEIAWQGSLNQFQMLSEQRMADFDCAVSTVSLNEALPYVLVDFSLPPRDVQALSRLLEGMDGMRDFDLSSLFDRRLFGIEENPVGKDELLASMCRELVDAGISDEEVLALVMQREGFSSTSLSADFAIPHPMRPCSTRTGVAVRILRHPTRWSDMADAVRIVFLLFIRPGDIANIEPLFNALVKLSESAPARRRMANVADSDEFLDVVRALR